MSPDASDALAAAGHHVVHRAIVPDDRYALRAAFSALIADADVDVILSTGSTGLTGRDIAVEALTPLFDKEIEGFGELFRAASVTDIGAATIQSRAFAGLANATIIFCMPGSPNACRTAWCSGKTSARRFASSTAARPNWASSPCHRCARATPDRAHGGPSRRATMAFIWG